MNVDIDMNISAPHIPPRIYEMLPPNSTIGILGGGQLGRMAALAAARLGYQCYAWEPSKSSPISQICPTLESPYDDPQALKTFLSKVDVVTIEFENIDLATLQQIATIKPCAPSPAVLSITRDRIKEKTFFAENAIPTNRWQAIITTDDCHNIKPGFQFPAVLKVAQLGYDGKGQRRVNNKNEVMQAWQNLNSVPCILEEFVDFDCEISAIGACNWQGETAIYETAHNIHENHILRRSILPAYIGDDIKEQAKKATQSALKALNVVGLLAIEFFVTKDNKLLANEMAPRPHNSGHWTMDGAITSQFEQLIRAVAAMPLGDTSRHCNIEMYNILGDEIADIPTIAANRRAKLHLYGKADIREGRKMAHINYIRD